MVDEIAFLNRLEGRLSKVTLGNVAHEIGAMLGNIRDRLFIFKRDGHPVATLIRERDEARAEVEKLRGLVAKLDEYIAFLNVGNEAPVRMAWAHGWRCPDDVFQTGERLRAEIEAMRAALATKEGA